jgi:hypothetical protein
LLLAENCKIVEGWAIQTMGGAATGDWVSMKGYERAMIVVHITNGNASSGALTVQAATDTSGTNGAAMTMTNVWAKTDYVLGTTTATTLTKQTAAATFTTDATITTDQWWIVDIDAAELGLNATSGLPNDAISPRLALSNAANYSSCMIYLYNPRYAQATMDAVEPIGD